MALLTAPWIRISSRRPQVGDDVNACVIPSLRAAKERDLGVAADRDCSPAARNDTLLNRYFFSQDGLTKSFVRSSFGNTTWRSHLSCHCANSRLGPLPPAFTSCISSNSIVPGTPT